jgi:hypothetical protein
MLRRPPDLQIAWMTVRYRVVLLAAMLLALLAGSLWLLAPGERSGARQRISQYLRGLSGAAETAPGPGLTQQAHFTVLDGTVRVKKSNRNLWSPATFNVPLEKGDVVQTGPDGIARLAFLDGTSYAVMPDSLVVIEESSLNRQQRTQVSVEVTTGTVDLATGIYSEGSSSRVTMAGAQASFGPRSTATVLNDPRADRHRILLKQGSGTVTRNGESLALKEYESANFSAAAPAMTLTREIAPPALVSPPHLAEFKASPAGAAVYFSWTATAGSQIYRLRVSPNPYFSAAVIDRRVRQNSLQIQGLKPGRYFWVVTSEDSEGHASVESDRNQFTLAASGAAASAALELQPFQRHGRVLEIKGTAEAGARVTINGQLVGDMRPDGSFIYFTPPLAAGENLITVTAVNSEGASRTVQQKITVE